MVEYYNLNKNLTEYYYSRPVSLFYRSPLQVPSTGTFFRRSHKTIPIRHCTIHAIKYNDFFPPNNISRTSLKISMTRLDSFSHKHLLVIFDWSQCDSKSHQVSRTLLSILSTAVVWMVSVRPSILNSSSPLTKSSGAVTNYYYYYYSFQISHTSVN